MNINKFAPRRLGYVIGLIMASLVGGLVSAMALAAIPDASGLIHGCYNSSGLLANGQLRVIDSASATCSTGETALNWNQNGGTGGLVSNLVGADFSSASIPYRNFAGLDMHNAIFDGANVTGSNFQGTNLANTTFRAPLADNANFASANLSGSTLGFGQNASGTFAGANLSNTKIISTGGYANYQSVTMANATIEGVLAGDFTGVDFRTVQFFTDPSSGLSPQVGGAGVSKFTNANFSGLTFSAVGFGTADYSGTNFSNAHFVSSGLAGVNFGSANFTGATWSGTQCPDATMSGNDGNTCTGHMTP